MTNRIARTCALSGVLALAFAGALTPAANAATVVPTLDADLTPVTLLGTNDFHGHFTKDFACTVASAEQEFPGSAFISAGDNVGGSPFESASQDDNPSIDYLNALKLQVSSVGNHEFDKGFDDLTGHVQSRAQWTYLGANVYEKGTTTPALPEYKVLDVNGVKVAVVGAVTTDTKNMVGADGIASIDFGDPVAAVNRVAAKLKDGDPSNGEADVVVAEYHEGAPEGGSATLEQMESASPVFKNIVTKTSANVSAIFTGHTHQLYDWDAPMPDGDGTRPIIQTDFYAHNLGILNLGYDKASGKVKQYSVVNRKVTAPTDACASLPAYTAAASIVDSANARAAQIGQQVIAQATGPITSALKPDGSRDDRLAESNLSNAIAQSYVDSLNAPGRPGSVEIGIMNPGGVRADLVPDAAGNLTFAQAAAVMPFNNTVATREISGATFVKLLEQQWQPDGASRPFLKMGLSSNVTYTFDETKPAGSRITSVMVGGKPIDPAAKYTVASNSFLMAGGDNFTALNEGGPISDSGLIDQGLFVEWLKAHSPVKPSYAKQSLSIHGQPTNVKAGEKVEFTASGFDMTSKNSPTNTSVEVSIAGHVVGTFPISATSAATPPYPANHGEATISFTAPSDLAAGDAVITLRAKESGTTGSFPVTLEAGATTTPTPTPTTEPTMPTTEPTTPTTEPTTPTTEPTTPTTEPTTPTTEPTTPTTEPTTPTTEPTTPTTEPTTEPTTPTTEPTTPTTEPTTPTTEPTTPPAGSTSSTTGATETGSASDGASPTTTTGPKVDTDGVSNERAVTGLAGLAVVVVAAGAGIAMRLRRQS